MLPRVRQRPDAVRHWISYWTDRVDAYCVWFYQPERLGYEYGPVELAASLPGMEIEAVLEDGVIFKISKDCDGNAQSPDAETILQAIRKNARLVARADFDIYMDGGRLPEHRRQCAFDNLDFDVTMLRLGGSCTAVRNLPNYPIARIRTGQHIDGQGRLWESEFNPD